MKKQLKTKVNGHHRPGQTYSVLGIDSIATQKGSGYETTTSPYIYSVTWLLPFTWNNVLMFNIFTCSVSS